MNSQENKLNINFSLSPPDPPLFLKEPMAALQVKAGDDDSDSAFSDMTETSVATCSTYDGSITAAGLGTDISNDSKVRYTGE